MTVGFNNCKCLGQFLCPALCDRSHILKSTRFLNFSPIYTQFVFLGELTEAQKEELEINRSQVGHLQGEMLELRQQLAKLSQIVDKQSDELRAKDSEIG
jgi:hypothetical protein